MNKIESASFSNEIESLILHIVDSGETDFNEILKSLPGVYPSTVLTLIKKMIYKKQIKEELLGQLFYETQLFPRKLTVKPNFRIPHPLDYHWKFTQLTCNRLLNIAQEFTDIGNVIGLIGTPSLLEKPHDFFNEREIISFDKNPLDHRITKLVKCTHYKRNLLTDLIPKIRANLAISDPPWYPEYFKAFLWVAGQSVVTNGYLLLSIPLEGIRPTMKQELSDIFNFAQNLGFSLIRCEKKSIAYNMPQFEKNALSAAGFENIANEWRTADLAIFRKTRQVSLPRPVIKTKEKWFEIILNSIDIRVKEKHSLEFLDPTLIPITDEEIFPSVSRRESLREIIDVWTSGNRVYLCKGTHILICILKSMQENKSPIEMISSLLNRKLNSTEIIQILKTVKKIEEIVIKELSEL